VILVKSNSFNRFWQVIANVKSTEQTHGKTQRFLSSPAAFPGTLGCKIRDQKRREASWCANGVKRVCCPVSQRHKPWAESGPGNIRENNPGKRRPV